MSSDLLYKAASSPPKRRDRFTAAPPLFFESIFSGGQGQLLKLNMMNMKASSTRRGRADSCFAVSAKKHVDFYPVEK